MNNSNLSSSFIKALCAKWDELHETCNIFRYKPGNMEERLLGGKYLIQLNPDRLQKRRAPEEMNDICQPLDANKFNFTKVSAEEVLSSFTFKGPDVHKFIVNVSPISRHHMLLCPAVDKCLPQVVTADSLELAVSIMFEAGNRDLRIVFNSLCGFASVNHLHYHLLFEKNDLYVESVEWQHINGIFYRLTNNYPVQAFCFEIPKHSIVQSCTKIYALLEYLLKHKIAHNILITSRCREVFVIIWPRRSTMGVKKLTAFNVAALELGGWFVVYDPEYFKSMQAEDLDQELSKWRIDNFDQLCEDIKYIFND